MEDPFCVAPDCYHFVRDESGVRVCYGCEMPEGACLCVDIMMKVK
jgi:hypothetical protein